MAINTPGTGLTRQTITGMIKNKEIELIDEHSFRAGRYNDTPFDLVPAAAGPVVRLGAPPACDPNDPNGSWCSIAGGKKNKKRKQSRKRQNRQKTHKRRKSQSKKRRY